jgi:hypothetical protein
MKSRPLNFKAEIAKTLHNPAVYRGIFASGFTVPYSSRAQEMPNKSQFQRAAVENVMQTLDEIAAAMHQVLQGLPDLGGIVAVFTSRRRSAELAAPPFHEPQLLVERVERAQSLRKVLFGRSLYRIRLAKRVLSTLLERWDVVFMHGVVRGNGPFAAETENFARAGHPATGAAWISHTSPGAWVLRTQLRNLFVWCAAPKPSSSVRSNLLSSRSLLTSLNALRYSVDLAAQSLQKDALCRFLLRLPNVDIGRLCLCRRRRR